MVLLTVEDLPHDCELTLTAYAVNLDLIFIKDRLEIHHFFSHIAYLQLCNWVETSDISYYTASKLSCMYQKSDCFSGGIMLAFLRTYTSKNIGAIPQIVFTPIMHQSIPNLESDSAWPRETLRKKLPSRPQCPRQYRWVVFVSMQCPMYWQAPFLRWTQASV